MELVDMKMTADERRDIIEPGKPSEGPKYPWGLRIELNDEAMEKIGLPALPAAGETMILHAQVEVSTVNIHDVADGKKERSMSLQIKRMALESDKTSLDAEKVLYGGEQS